ncbi:hypothetical protein T09_10933 [Trichinella sp. T9]|nr:hypothetical protein T09_10933 [Trichinella sp. T9]
MNCYAVEKRLQRSIHEHLLRRSTNTPRLTAKFGIVVVIDAKEKNLTALLGCVSLKCCEAIKQASAHLYGTYEK